MNVKFSIWLFDLAIGFFRVLSSLSVYMFEPLEIAGITFPVTPASIFLGTGLTFYFARIIIKFFTT